MELQCVVTGNFSTAWNRLGAAIRMVGLLKLDVDPDDLEATKGLSWIEKETRRRCFWVAAILDICKCCILSGTYFC
jgi:hypothetical protein